MYQESLKIRVRSTKHCFNLLQLEKKLFTNIFCHDLSLRGVSKHKYVENTSTCLEHEKKMSKCVTVLLAVVIRHLHFKKKIGCKHIFKNLNRYVENTSTCLEHGKKMPKCVTVLLAVVIRSSFSTFQKRTQDSSGQATVE